MKVPGKAGSAQIESLEVKDPFVNIEAQIKAVEHLKRQLYQVHAYYFTPDLSLAEEDARIQKFLDETDVEPNVVIEEKMNGKTVGHKEDPIA